MVIISEWQPYGVKLGVVVSRNLGDCGGQPFIGKDLFKPE